MKKQNNRNLLKIDGCKTEESTSTLFIEKNRKKMPIEIRIVITVY